MGDEKIVAPFHPVVDDLRGFRLDIDQKARILAADLVIELDQRFAERKVEHPWDNQNRRRQRHAGGSVNRWQTAQKVAHGGRVIAAVIPCNVRDGAQHRIEHDGAWPCVGAIRAADGAVIIGDEGDGGRAAGQERRRIGGR